MYGLIYKSDVKDLLYSAAEEAYGDEEGLLNSLTAKVDDIQEVPAREVDTSHWITYGNLMTCEKCGNELKQKFMFCPKCGYKFIERT